MTEGSVTRSMARPAGAQQCPVNGEDAPSRVAAEVQRILRAHHEGVLKFGDRHETRRYVTDPMTCMPVLSLSHDAAEQYADVVLAVPDDSDPALEILAQPRLIDRRTHATADRFLIYHGESEDRGLFILSIETARCHAGLISGDDIPAPDPLHDIEPEICLEMNSDPARVARVCAAGVKVMPLDAVMVGLDRFGLDVRARFGMVRVEFDAPVEDEEAARRAIARLEGK